MRKVLELLKVVFPDGRLFSGGFFIPGFSGMFNGFQFSVRTIPAGKNTPPRLLVSLNKGGLFHLKIRKESYLSGLGKTLGLVHEVRVGDAAFDEAFLITSNKPEEASRYLMHEVVRRNITELFEFGYRCFLIDSKNILIEKPYYSVKVDLDPQHMKIVVQKLFDLSKGLYSA